MRVAFRAALAAGGRDEAGRGPSACHLDVPRREVPALRAVARNHAHARLGHGCLDAVVRPGSTQMGHIWLNRARPCASRTRMAWVVVAAVELGFGRVFISSPGPFGLAEFRAKGVFEEISLQAQCNRAMTSKPFSFLSFLQELVTQPLTSSHPRLPSHPRLRKNEGRARGGFASEIVPRERTQVRRVPLPLRLLACCTLRLLSGPGHSAPPLSSLPAGWAKSVQTAASSSQAAVGGARSILVWFFPLPVRERPAERDARGQTDRRQTVMKWRTL